MTKNPAVKRLTCWLDASSLYRRADIKGKTLILLRFSLQKKTLPGFLPRISAVCEKWRLPISVFGKLARVFIRSGKQGIDVIPRSMKHVFYGALVKRLSCQPVTLKTTGSNPVRIASSYCGIPRGRRFCSNTSVGRGLPW